ncbi:MAG: hypothetical protein ACLR7D_13490 [Lachnospira eligens]
MVSCILRMTLCVLILTRVKGCQTVCCQNMGSTIVLDPYDCYKLTIGLGKTFEQLTMNELELNVVDGSYYA